MLIKSQIIFPKVEDRMFGEMGEDFSNHFRAFDGYQMVLLMNGFPLHPTELIDLAD